MAKVFQFIASGFEEVEALVPVDVFRRGGVDIKTVSVTGSNVVESSHGVKIHTDLTFGEAEPMLDDADLLMLPGGMPGASNLAAHDGVKKALMRQAEKGGMIAAICAAPMVLGKLGLLRGRRATCYPGFEDTLEGAEYTAGLVTVDGNITTGEGPAAALPYAYSLLGRLTDTANSDAVAEGMLYPHLMGKR